MSNHRYLTREERDWLRHQTDAARRNQLRHGARLKIVEYGAWTPERTAAGNRALDALREATRRDHERRKKAA